ncbi:MAG: AI-2E family transporter [Acidimicrobiia bacterium]
MSETSPDVVPETTEVRRERDLNAVITRMGIAAWSLVGAAVLIWIVLLVLGRIQILLAPIVLAVAIIYILNPLVGWLSDRHVPRILAAMLGFLFLLAVLAGIGAAVAPVVTNQGSELTTSFPQIYEDTASDLENMAADMGFNVDLWSYDQLQQFIHDPQAQDQILSVVWSRLGDVTSGVLEAILVFVIAPVVAFYVLIDLPRVRKEATALIPERHRAEVLHVTRRLGGAVGGFLRGQMLVALIVGVLTSTGFWIIGLNFWLIIGMLAGALNIIPFVGPWVGGFLGVMVGFVTADARTAVLAALVALLVQQLDNHLISPNVLRATVHLHPALIILLILLGGGVGGIWGVLLAVPVAASIKIVAGHLWRTRVLGQTWEDAYADMMESSHPPEPLLDEIIREIVHADAGAQETDEVGAPDGGDEPTE